MYFHSDYPDDAGRSFFTTGIVKSREDRDTHAMSSEKSMFSFIENNLVLKEPFCIGSAKFGQTSFRF